MYKVYIPLRFACFELGLSGEEQKFSRPGSRLTPTAPLSSDNGSLNRDAEGVAV